jgi:hypothetical protein
MSLLAADLRALANLPTNAVGRRMTLGLIVGLGLLSLMSWWLAKAVIDSSELQRVMGLSAGQDVTARLIGYGLMTCPMVATWLGLATAQKQLFETPELMLWRQAPIAGYRGPLQIFLRSVFLSTLWATALSAPFVVAVMQKSPAPTLAYALIPLAVLSCTVPLLATLLSVQIVMVRFLAGRWLRLILSAIAALASVGFTIWLLLSLFTNGGARIQEIEVATQDSQRMAITVHAAATMLSGAVNRVLTLQQMLPVLGWTLGSLVLFFCVSLLHPRAHERFIESNRPMWRRSNQRWPTSLASNVRKKEFAQVLQQPGALIGFLVFAVLVFALARERVLVGNILSYSRLPHEVRNLAALLTWWFLAVLLVLYAHMGRLALWDGAQWPLYISSPARPGWILRGKLQAIGVFLLWPLLLVAGIGVQTLGVELKTTLWFLGFALTGTAIALAVVAVVGTWPRLMRPDNEGQILQGGKSFFAAMVMVTTFHITMMPAAVLWSWVTNPRNRITSFLADEWLPWILGIAASYAAVIAIIGFLVGGWNYRRLLAPR